MKIGISLRRVGVLLGLVAAVGALGGCAGPGEQLRPQPASAPVIRQIDVGTATNVFVVMGERPILVDAGWAAAGATEKIEKGLQRLGIRPGDLALIVLTHGHGDHAGGVPRLRALTGAKVVAGAGDVEMLQAGHNRPLHPMGALGRLIRPFIDKPFTGFAPDIALTAPLDLGPYGIAGQVLPTPGHTPGSLSVVLASGDALVGDMLRGGTVRSQSPARHYFHDDCRAAEAHIATLLAGGTRRFYVGHGGPLDAPAVQAYFRDNPCP